MEFCFDNVQDNVLIVKASGTLNSKAAGQFRESIGKMVEIRLWNIIVDCSELDDLSIYGLWVLVRLHRQVEDKHGDVKIASASGWIATMLCRTRLNGLFKIYPDVPSACEAFKKVKKTPLILR
ncbi:MAG: anti-sigma factor antagonist [Planctomycetota bacterium]|nr:MAG: anti-sigma factor antagonist [Planctomycetota bacterium]